MILTIISSLFLIPIYLWFRNKAVFKFRISIIDEDYENNTDQYDRLPSYDSMVLSFKKLTKENYLKV
jgi:hypothetical protein